MKLRLFRSGIAGVDRMPGPDFEEFLAALFVKEGYAVRRIGRTGDFGGDLILAKRGVRIVVQAKRYRGFVGVRAVQEAVGAKGYYRCDRAWVVTNSRFTSAAAILARANGIELYDRDRLIRWLLHAQKTEPS
jgi:restriction system protein